MWPPDCLTIPWTTARPKRRFPRRLINSHFFVMPPGFSSLSTTQCKRLFFRFPFGKPHGDHANFLCPVTDRPCSRGLVARIRLPIALVTGYPFRPRPAVSDSHSPGDRSWTTRRCPNFSCAPRRPAIVSTRPCGPSSLTAALRKMSPTNLVTPTELFGSWSASFGGDSRAFRRRVRPPFSRPRRGPAAQTRATAGQRTARR